MKHGYNGRNLPIMNMVEYGTGKFAFNHIDIDCVMEASVFFTSGPLTFPKTRIIIEPQMKHLTFTFLSLCSI